MAFPCAAFGAESCSGRCKSNVRLVPARDCDLAEATLNADNGPFYDTRAQHPENLLSDPEKPGRARAWPGACVCRRLVSRLETIRPGPRGRINAKRQTRMLDGTRRSTRRRLPSTPETNAGRHGCGRDTNHTPYSTESVFQPRQALRPVQRN